MALYIVLLVIILLIDVHRCDRNTLRLVKEEQCYGDICWNNQSYPLEKINQKLSVETSFSTLGIMDQVETFVKPLETCKLCKSMMKLNVKPLSFIDKESGKEFFIVHGKNFQQDTIILNVCDRSDKQEDSMCVKGWERLDYVKECKQKYTTMHVLVYDEKKNEFEGKHISYPSACDCMVRNVIFN